MTIGQAMADVSFKKSKDVFPTNSPYNQTVPDSTNRRFFLAMLDGDYFGTSPTNLRVWSGYEALCRDHNLGPFVAYPTLQDNQAMINNLAKYISHLVLHGPKAKSKDPQYESDAYQFNRNDAMCTLRAGIREAERAVTAEQLSGGITQAEANRILQMCSLKNCVKTSRKFIANVIDRLALFITLNTPYTSVTMWAKAKVELSGAAFRDTLKHNARVVWHFLLNNIRGGFEGELFLYHQYWPALAELVAFSNKTNVYYMLARARSTSITSSQKGIVCSWEKHFGLGDPFGHDSITQGQMMWVHHFFLWSLIDPDFRPQKKVKMINMTDFPVKSTQAFAQEWLQYMGHPRSTTANGTQDYKGRWVGAQWPVNPGCKYGGPAPHLISTKQTTEFVSQITAGLQPSDDNTLGQVYPLNGYHRNFNPRKGCPQRSTNKNARDGYYFFGGAWQDFMWFATKEKKYKFGTKSTRFRWRHQVNESKAMTREQIIKARLAMYGQRVVPAAAAAAAASGAPSYESDSEGGSVNFEE